MILRDRKNPLSISVMAHPSREAFFPYLRERLGEDVPFAIDEKSEGVWPNARRAWALHDPDAIYHVVIQDDAIVCDNFKERAFDAICRGFNHMEGRPFAVNFYFGRRGNLTEQSKKALERGWCSRQSPTWGVAIALPVDHIKPMLEYAEGFDSPQDDYRIGMYLKKHGIPVSYTHLTLPTNSRV